MDKQDNNIYVKTILWVKMVCKRCGNPANNTKDLSKDGYINIEYLCDKCFDEPKEV